MISADRAIDTILSNIDRLEIEDIDIHSAYDSVLAEDVKADIDIPPFDKSAMDGYAVRARDITSVPATLGIQNTVKAGDSVSEGVKSGLCVKIMTGAPVPSGADSVVMVEDTQIAEDGGVEILKEVEKGQNICLQGEDVKKGTVVLKRNTVIDAPEIAILSSVGKSVISVYKKPEVAIISTGNEIVEPGKPLKDGQIRNSNGPMLRSMVISLGCKSRYLGIAADTEPALRKKIRDGFKSDVLLLSGGVSMGEYDLIPKVVSDLGAKIFFHKVLVKPGKPLLFALKGKTVIFGIPGNPVSNFTTFHVFIKPALLKMMGITDFEVSLNEAIMDIDFKNRNERVHIVPSRFFFKGTELRVTPFTLNGSADIIGCSKANCLTIIEKNRGNIKKGERVKVLPLN
ncbi:MAG: molybdopterin molybdotransferase MoeA [Spirochaetota bacterium]|nr:MAG: molybdopterin molybdotransferase MoeA [Spirochaetota bacterium]